MAAKRQLVWTQTHQVPGSADQGVRRLTTTDLGVAFQPIVDVATGQLFAHEALVRPKAPEYPNPPALFEAAEREVACGRIGRLIREVAFATCGDVPLFVNLHPQELSSRWLVQADDPIGFHTKPVYLEVTESAAFEHFEVCRDVIADLSRRSGALFVVDDFGAGYSNLARVVDLAPAVIKLDLALTHDIDKLKARQVVVRHMVNMCKELGARVVAEGVETVDELSCVRDLGVDYVQGYLLARPATPPPRPSWPLAQPKVEAAVPRRAPPPLPKAATRKSTRPPGSKAPAARAATEPPASRGSGSTRATRPAPPRG
jgi:EAL domain-containing protein (putative c-di-GMP-specific phosphodiesterase class I)